MVREGNTECCLRQRKPVQFQMWQLKRFTEQKNGAAQIGEELGQVYGYRFKSYKLLKKLDMTEI